MFLVVYNLGLALCRLGPFLGVAYWSPSDAVGTLLVIILLVKCLSRKLTYSSYLRVGEVIKHGDLKCIHNEGMPIYKSPMDKGSLIIQFLVR